jgi:crossover junction endodeoxyribonuclease RusA
MSGDRPPLSLNHRLNHYAKARITKDIRTEAGWLARSTKIPALEKCRVEITWVVPDGRRRDEDNPAPSAKAVYDGLVDAGVVKDDTPEYMEKLTVKIEQVAGQRSWFVTVYEVAPGGL